MSRLSQLHAQAQARREFVGLRQQRIQAAPAVLLADAHAQRARAVDVQHIPRILHAQRAVDIRRAVQVVRAERQSILRGEQPLLGNRDAFVEASPP
jgi:hypothetical protein